MWVRCNDNQEKRLVNLADASSVSVVPGWTDQKGKWDAVVGAHFEDGEYTEILHSGTREQCNAALTQIWIAMKCKLEAVEITIPSTHSGPPCSDNEELNELPF
jgi:hypothetical protein